MSAHTIDLFAELMDDELIQRFHRLFKRFRRDLDGALERADEEYGQHMPSKGDVCEFAVLRYLSETLGSRYTVIANAHVFDSTGAQSREQDVVIFDDYWSSRLVPRESSEPPIIPVESVYATIQVKKALRARDLRDSIDNIQSFKSLQREAVGPERVTPNRTINGLGRFSQAPLGNPYFSAVFAFTAERSMEAVIEQLKSEVADIPAKQWPDVIAVHNEGVILPFCSTCQCSGTHIGNIAADGHEPSYLLDELDGSYSVLGFHFLLMSHLHDTILGPLYFYEMYRKLAGVARSLSRVSARS